MDTKSLPLLVSPGEVAELVQAGAADLRIVDYGRSGISYLIGHVPGAVRLPKDVVFDRVDGVDGRLPSPETVAAALGKAGIGNDMHVVIYGQSDGLWAARLFWALEYLGHGRLSIMNGGLQGWKSESLPIERGAVSVEPAGFRPSPEESRFASTDWMLSRHGDERVRVIDARSPSEYETHIPSAVNIEWTENLINGQGGVLKELDELSSVYARARLDESDEIVTYCQVGVRAAHAYFALRMLGYENVRVYDDSWAVWGSRDGAPVEP